MTAGGIGHSKLWGWFSLSYMSFVVLPRVCMHDMPDEWQGRMADLLQEYNDAFPNLDFDWRVQYERDGKLAKFPEWLLNYRYPNETELAKARQSEYGSTVDRTDPQSLVNQTIT